MYSNYGDIAHLPKVMELKEKYKYRLISKLILLPEINQIPVDDSFGIGVLGTNGRGTCEYYNIPVELCS